MRTLRGRTVHKYSMASSLCVKYSVFAVNLYGTGLYPTEVYLKLKKIEINCI